VEERVMTSKNPVRIIGSVRAENGRGAVRMEDRLGSGIDDVWSALTDPARLMRWYGEVEADLRPGGEYRAHLHASGWEGTGRVDACEAPRHLMVSRAEPGRDPGITEITLTADGDETLLVWEERGMPLRLIAAYGAGVQIHAEDLIAHLAGQERCDAAARFAELQPAYEELAARIG
jgi:uncharacterized protein YndB with AHSA1/START domain